MGSGEASTKSPEKGVLSPEKGGMVPAAKRWIPKQEVIQRLRDIFEPITIFGETDEERIERLRKAELTRPDEEEMGQKNFLAEQKKKEQQKKAQGDSSDEETLTPEEKRAKKMARLEVLKRAEENAKVKARNKSMLRPQEAVKLGWCSSVAMHNHLGRLLDNNALVEEELCVSPPAPKSSAPKV